MASAKSMFISSVLEGVRISCGSPDAIGQRALDLFAGVKGAKHRDRFNGRQSKRGRHVGGNGGEPEHLDVKLFTRGFDSLEIRARIVPETKLQRMPHDRFPDLLAMGRKLVADGRANEVRAVEIKAFLHQQIDMAEVNVTQVNGDLFGFARSIAEPLNFSCHVHSPSDWMVYGWSKDGLQEARRGRGGRRLATGAVKRACN